MADRVTSPPTSPPNVTPPEFVSAEEYMEKYAEHFYEWENGRLIKMAPIHIRHDELTRYFRSLLDAYFSLKPIGRVVGEPFVLRLDNMKSYREPDLQIILNDNPGQFTDTAMIGPADICIEVVSPGSVEIDYGKKLVEYEKGGVKEYWLIDPIRKASHFHRLSEAALYEPVLPNSAGNYETPLLPELKLHVPTLWEEPLPDVIRIVETVRQMLGK